MPAFIHDDFLLETDVARDLYHRVAAKQPIIDYHCHLPPDQIADNHKFATLTEIWLNGDHYKWRAMRANGVPERLCTGSASDWEKFEAWAKTVPQTLRNPLYHWTHLELRRPFGIADRLLGPDTARAIFDRCNELLATDAFSTQGLLQHFDVKVVCSTDDPCDDLDAHRRHAKNPKASTRLYPTWRPDKVMAVENVDAFNAWVDRLEGASNVSIGDYRGLLEALQARHAYFHEVGCRASDHGIETAYAEDFTEAQAANVFAKLRKKTPISAHETLVYKSAILHELAVMDHARGWAQQFHLGALRNVNTRLLSELGPDTGFDSIGDFEIARPLGRFLDGLERDNKLTRTIVYNLNPRDNELVATMMGNFQDGSSPGRMQFGASWWFLDQLDGMEKQMNALSNMGLLSRFIGMLTDSRSFLSYSRHEYFRRLLCNMLGNDVRRGLVPNDRALLSSLVADVCFGNAKSYFGFELPSDSA